MRPVEPLVLRQPELGLQLLTGDRHVAADVETADAIAAALGDRDRDDQPVALGLDVGVADFDAQEAGVGVLALGALQVLHEDRLGVGARFVEEARRVRPEAPGLRAHPAGQLLVREVLVALEADLAQAELAALVDLEVHRDGVVRQRRDVVADARLVVAFGAIQRLDAIAVLVQQRQVERRAGRQRQLVADAVGIDRVVAGDRDLPHHRILFDVEGEDAPVGGLRREHADVLEEAQRMDLAHVLGDARGVVAIARLRRDARADGVRLDAPVAGDADLGDPVRADGGGLGRAEDALRRDQSIGDDDAVGAALGLGLRAGEPGARAQPGDVGPHRVAVEGASRLHAQLAPDRVFLARGALDPDLHDAPAGRLAPRHDHEHTIRELVDAAAQRRLVVGGEHHRLRRNRLADGRHARVQAVRAGQLGEARLHDPLRPDLAGQLAQHLVGAVAGYVRHQRLAHHDGVDDAHPAAGFEPLAQLPGERADQRREIPLAVDLERQQGDQHLDRRLLRARARRCGQDTRRDPQRQHHAVNEPPRLSTRHAGPRTFGAQAVLRSGRAPGGTLHGTAGGKEGFGGGF